MHIFPNCRKRERIDLETKIKKVKKKYKKYEKKTYPLVSLNVANYLSGVSGNKAADPPMQYFLLKYLREHRDAEFKTLNEISAAIRKEFGFTDSTCNPSTVSKVISSIQGDLWFEDGVYYFDKKDGIYKLRTRISNNKKELQKLFAAKDMFWREDVHFIGKNTAVFSVNPSRIGEAKKGFLQLFGPSCCFGVMAVDEHLVIMLNQSGSHADAARDLMRDFFKNKREYEARLEEKKRREEERERQNKAILGKQKHTKYGKFI